MNAAIGESAVVLGLVASIVGVITLAIGLVRGRTPLLRAGRTYTWLILAGAVLAAFAMERGLLTNDFSLKYVAANGGRATPLLFKITGMWSALEGSIILWTSSWPATSRSWSTSTATAGAIRWSAGRRSSATSWSAFFFMLMVGPANPFHTLGRPYPTDGPGPNPLLQNHPLVAFHPPMLYLGFVGFTIPFAFAVASLITGRMGEGWLVETRRWTLFAWGFLTIGIILGAWWSYEVLGWGGFWAWDPVENASFLPWLTGTAYLHSVMVQERRGMLRLWNLSLLLATFSLTILGTFLTRSGVLDSVHAFTTSGIGPTILAFFAVVVAVTVGLIAWRGDRLRSPGTIDSPVSREGAFLANNLLFAGFAFVVLLGTVFPLLAEAINNQRISVGSPYFDRMTMPLVVALLFLMAVAPVLPWRKASAELLRHRLQWPARAGGGDRGGVGPPRRPGPQPAGRLRARSLRGRLGRAPTGAGHPPPRRAGPARPGQRRHDRPYRRRRDRRGLRGQPLLRPPDPGQPAAGPVANPRRPHHHLSRRRPGQPSEPVRPSRPGSGSTGARSTVRRSASTTGGARRWARHRSAPPRVTICT